MGSLNAKAHHIHQVCIDFLELFLKVVDVRWTFDHEGLPYQAGPVIIQV